MTTARPRPGGDDGGHPLGRAGNDGALGRAGDDAGAIPSAGRVTSPPPGGRRWRRHLLSRAKPLAKRPASRARGAEDRDSTDRRSGAAQGTGGGDGNRTRVQGFAGPCLNHSATPPRKLPGLRPMRPQPTGSPWIPRTAGWPLRCSASPSGRRDSNPRPSPWQGDALPTEPRPHASHPTGRRRERARRANRTVADPGRRANSGSVKSRFAQPRIVSCSAGNVWLGTLTFLAPATDAAGPAAVQKGIPDPMRTPMPGPTRAPAPGPVGDTR